MYDLMDYIFVTQDFLLLLQEKNREMDLEIHFKDTFRAFSKDEDGKQYTKSFEKYNSVTRFQRAKSDTI
jgi:hypothetical protein